MKITALRRFFYSVLFLIRRSNILYYLVEKMPQFKYRYEAGLRRAIVDNYEQEVTVEIISNIKMHLTLKDWVQQNLFINKYYELAETKFWLRFLENKKSVFDVGANVGYFSLLASKQLKKNNGVVHSFEPVSKTFNRLDYNIQLNNSNNVVLNKIALSSSDGIININIGNDDNWGMSSINEHDFLSGVAEKVVTQTMDNYVSKNNIKKIDAVKIDVEGSEFMVLKGMSNVLKTLRPIILIEILDVNLNKAGSTKEDIYNFLWEQNYDSFRILDGEKVEKIDSPISYDGLTYFHPKEKKMEQFIRINP